MNDTTQLLALAIQARVPTIAWGPPGVGKSATIAAIGKALNAHTETIIASIREPADFAGLPAIIGDNVRMVPPAWAQNLVKAGGGIAFFDEISTAAPAVQAGLLRVILDRVVGDLTLPPTVAMVAAANPPEQAAGGWELSAPLANRFMHLSWSLDAKAWADGMIGGWPTPSVPRLPVGWESNLHSQRPLIASFMQVRPHLLSQVPKDAADAGRAWPSPRTWDMAARILAALEGAGASHDMRTLALAGCVGAGNATEFLAWQRDLDLPDPEKLLADPGSFKLPKRGDQQFATLAAVAAAVVRQPSRDRWKAGWVVLSMAAKSGAKDVAAASARALVHLGTEKTDLPLPVDELKPFVPLLKAAGLLGG